MPKRVLQPQSVWDVSALTEAFVSAGIKTSHAHKLWSALLKDPEVQWADIPDLPKAAAQLLASHFSRTTSKVVSCKTSSGADTTKLLIQMQDGLQVESVVMHYDTSDRYTQGDSHTSGWGNRRGTLCVSSQVGCQMGCTFCATGTMGLKGNLSTGEIIEQLVHALRVTPVRNVVFMGMGEPLSNYDAVLAAVGLMTDPRLFGLSKRHVTVSTVGVVPKIKQMATDLKGVSLALSLHAPTQELRQQIVPSARAYPLQRLMGAVEEYQAATGQKVFVEYVMLSGVNDGLEQAHQLGQLLQGRDVVVNLIPWNPVYSPGGPFFSAPQPGSVSGFQQVVRGQYGLHCTVRQEKGQDIAGACGQLVVEAAGLTGSSGCGPRKHISTGAGAAADIEDLVPPRTTSQAAAAVG